MADAPRARRLAKRIVQIVASRWNMRSKTPGWRWSPSPTRGHRGPAGRDGLLHGLRRRQRPAGRAASRWRARRASCGPWSAARPASGTPRRSSSARRRPGGRRPIDELLAGARAADRGGRARRPPRPLAGEPDPYRKPPRGRRPTTTMTGTAPTTAPDASTARRGDVPGRGRERPSRCSRRPTGGPARPRQPDADALGSALALGLALRRRGADGARLLRRARARRGVAARPRRRRPRRARRGGPGRARAARRPRHRQPRPARAAGLPRRRRGRDARDRPPRRPTPGSVRAYLRRARRRGDRGDRPRPPRRARRPRRPAHRPLPLRGPGHRHPQLPGRARPRPTTWPPACSSPGWTRRR